MSDIVSNAIDCHIHVQSEEIAEGLLQAMDQTHTQTAILMGSPRFTITLRPEDGFTRYQENNLELLKARKAHPDRFIVWPTLDPLAPNNPDRLRDYVGEGASGLKLYVGHGFAFGLPPAYLFHTTPIDSEPLMEVYRFCEKEGLPICLHINTSDNAPGFRQEFERVLEACPKLQVLAPHWMLAARRPKYLRGMLQRFKNLWIDVSFGQDKILEEGLRNVSKNAVALKQIVLDFPERVLYGSDLVCTEAPFKTPEWMSLRMLAYRTMLSSQQYDCPITGQPLTGLSLPQDVLIQVLRENALRLSRKG